MGGVAYERVYTHLESSPKLIHMIPSITYENFYIFHMILYWIGQKSYDND